MPGLKDMVDIRGGSVGTALVIPRLRTMRTQGADQPADAEAIRREAARLIESARDARRRPKLTITQAALAAGISRVWWSDVVNGRERTDDRILLDMAAVVGIEEHVAQMLGYEFESDHDPVERAIWAISDLDEQERRAMIAFHRSYNRPMPV